jgi:hypothetical protein
MLSMPEHSRGLKGKDQTMGRLRYPCGWGAGTGETVYIFLADDAREGMCDNMGVLNATNPPSLSLADSGAGCAADDACERRRRR